MHFLIEMMFILKVINPIFKESYDKQNFMPVVISYAIYKASYEMNTCVRSSIYATTQICYSMLKFYQFDKILTCDGYL